MSMGYRGGYAPFRQAVRTLSQRGEFNPAEVSNVEVDIVDTVTSRRDETIIKFPEGFYELCEYKLIDGEMKFAVSLDCDEGIYIETFQVEGLREDFGICTLLVKGDTIELSTTTDAGPYKRARSFKARRSSGTPSTQSQICGRDEKLGTVNREDRQSVQHPSPASVPERRPADKPGYSKSTGPIQVPQVGPAEGQGRRGSAGHGDDRTRRVWRPDVQGGGDKSVSRGPRNLSRNEAIISSANNGNPGRGTKVILRTSSPYDSPQSVLRWQRDCQVSRKRSRG